MLNSQRVHPCVLAWHMTRQWGDSRAALFVHVCMTRMPHAAEHSIAMPPCNINKLFISVLPSFSDDAAFCMLLASTISAEDIATFTAILHDRLSKIAGDSLVRRFSVILHAPPVPPSYQVKHSASH